MAGAAAGVPGRAGGVAGRAGCPADGRCRRRGRGSWRCAGWGVRGRPAWRWSTRTGTWPRWGWPGSSPPRTRAVLAAGFARAGGPARRPGACVMRGTRWRRCTRCWPRIPAGWLLVFDNAPDRASVQRFLPPAGPGRVLITSQNALWPPGQGLEVPVLDTEVAAGFLVSRTGDPDRQAAAGAGRRAGRAAAGAGAGRRLHAGHRRQPWRVPGAVPAAARGAAGPRRGRRVRQDGGHHLGAGVRPAASRPRRARPGCCGCWRAARPRRSRCGLLLQPRPGLADAARRGGAAVLEPLLEDPLAAGDAVAALRRYSLVSPGRGRAGVGAPAGPGRHPRSDARRAWPARGGRPPRP